MKLGQRVKCSGYEKKLKIKPVFLDEKSKRDWEAENTEGNEIANYFLLDDCDSQELFETVEADFEGIVIGKRNIFTRIDFYDAQEGYEEHCTAVGVSPKPENWSFRNNIKAVKCVPDTHYKIAFRMNQTRLVGAENIELVEGLS